MENKFNTQEENITGVEQYISTIRPFIEKDSSTMASNSTISTKRFNILQYKFDVDKYALIFL